jgi:hypothetical protein
MGVMIVLVVKHVPLAVICRWMCWVNSGLMVRYVI